MKRTMTIVTKEQEMAYFIQDMMYALKGVEDVEIWELITGLETQYKTVVTYEDEVVYLTREQVVDFIEYAEEDYVGFFMWLDANGMVKENVVF